MLGRVAAQIFEAVAGRPARGPLRWSKAGPKSGYSSGRALRSASSPGPSGCRSPVCGPRRSAEPAFSATRDASVAKMKHSESEGNGRSHRVSSMTERELAFEGQGNDIHAAGRPGSLQLSWRLYKGSVRLSRQNLRLHLKISAAGTSLARRSDVESTKRASGRKTKESKRGSFNGGWENRASDAVHSFGRQPSHGADP